MGWIEVDTDVRTLEERREFVRMLFGAGNVLRVANDINTFYVAVRNGECVEGYVVQTYINTRMTYGNRRIRRIGYKVEHEKVCPVKHTAPENFLSMLTATTNEGAVKWRSLCRRTIRNKKLLRTCPVGTKLQVVGKAVGIVECITDHDHRLWVNERHTLVFPTRKLWSEQLVPVRQSPNLQ